MALTQLPTQCEFIKWAEMERGDTIKGFFKESQESARFKGTFTHYVESTETGKLLGLAGSGALDRAIEQIPQGTYVEIEYDGMSEIKKGANAGTQAHSFKVAYDPERIHPLFAGGQADAHKPVEYKRDAGGAKTESAAPPLAKPEPNAPKSAPGATTTQQTAEPVAAAPAPVKGKRPF